MQPHALDPGLGVCAEGFNKPLAHLRRIIDITQRILGLPGDDHQQGRVLRFGRILELTHHAGRHGDEIILIKQGFEPAVIAIANAKLPLETHEALMGFHMRVDRRAVTGRTVEQVD